MSLWQSHEILKFKQFTDLIRKEQISEKIEM